jgi:hypothetical protein
MKYYIAFGTADKCVIDDIVINETTLVELDAKDDFDATQQATRMFECNYLTIYSEEDFLKSTTLQDMSVITLDRLRWSHPITLHASLSRKEAEAFIRWLGRTRVSSVPLDCVVPVHRILSDMMDKLGWTEKDL